MNRTTLVSLATIIGLLLACTLPAPQPGRGTTPASPRATGSATPAPATPAPTAVYTPVTSSTVGPAGGTLATNDFTLTVPPGALTATVTLKLSVSAEDKPFGDHGVSRVYRVEGLPATYTQPLPVRIKYQGTLSNRSFIAAGALAFIPELEMPAVAYSLLPATAVDGALQATLPARSVGKGDTVGAVGEPDPGKAAGLAAPMGQDLGELFAWYLLGVRHYDTDTTAGGHFKINYPIYQEEAVHKLGEYLEEAYTTFEKMGFRYPEVKWPVQVNVLHHGYHESIDVPAFPDDPVRLQFNEEEMGLVNLPRIREAAARAVFYLIAWSYDRQNFQQPSHIWFHRAAAGWAGETLAERPQDYRPPFLERPEVAQAPFRGLQAGSVGKWSWEHGWGMSAVIKYLVDRSTGNFLLVQTHPLVEVYQAIRNGTQPAKALLLYASGSEREWWPDFFTEYLQGNIYGVAPWAFTLDWNVTGVVNLTSAEPAKTVTAPYPDLSARLYLVNLQDIQADSNTTLRFTTSSATASADERKVLVFWRHDDKLYDPVTGADVQVAGIQARLKAGWNQLVAVVVNSSAHEPDYTTVSNIALKVEVVTTPQVLYNRARIGFRVFGTVTDGADGSTKYSVIDESGAMGRGETVGGRLDSKSIFTGSSSSNGITLTLVIAIDPTTHQVLSFDATKKASDYTLWRIQGTNLPCSVTNVDSPGGLECSVLGEGACAHITSVEWRNKHQHGLRPTDPWFIDELGDDWNCKDFTVTEPRAYTWQAMIYIALFMQK